MFSVKASTFFAFPQVARRCGEALPLFLPSFVLSSFSSRHHRLKTVCLPEWSSSSQSTAIGGRIYPSFSLFYFTCLDAELEFTLRYSISCLTFFYEIRLFLLCSISDFNE